MSKNTYILHLLKTILIVIGVVGSLNAQTHAKQRNKHIEVLKKNQQKGNLTTYSTTPSYCPVGPVIFDTYDASTGNSVSNSLNCNSGPFYLDANDNFGPSVTPCISSMYTSTDIFIGSNATENLYEGGVNTGCIGPSSSCYFQVGSGGFDSNHQWWVDDIFSDPSLQHNYQFCYQGLPLTVTTIQLQDCWSGDSLSSTNSFGIILPNPCFTDSVLAGTDIGTALYSIAPLSASVALTDYHNGEAYIDPTLLSAGNYTVTYNFTPPAVDSCPTITGTYTFSIAPISVSVNSATICPGGSATLTASGPGGTTYSWTPSSNLNATTGAMVIASPGTLTVYTVTGTKGICTGTATSTVTINPTPTITVNSPTICAGNSATLTAGGAASYTWSPSSSLTATTGSTVVTNTLSANTIFTVSTNSSGCLSQATTTVIVNAAPTLTVNTATICVGNTATLTASGATTYSWNTSAISASITPSPTTTTVYTVIGTASGCSASKTTTVTVNPLPTLTVNSPTICAATTATLTANGATTYTWSTSTISTSITPSPTTTTVYTVTGTNSNNCKNTATSTVTVNQPPALSVNTATICAGATATLTASGATTYTWNTSAINASITPSPTTTTVYTVNGTTNGCTTVKTTTVTVNPLPTVGVNSPTICVGNTATLTATGASTYTWSTAALVSTITPSPTVTTVYTVTGTDAHACKNSATSTVTVNSLPTISVNSPTICAGSTTTLTASGANTYNWNTGVTTSTLSTTPPTTTIYTVTGTNSNNCKNSATATVAVNALPVVNASSIAICAGNTTTLTASGASTYTWNTGATTATINTTPTSTTVYTVTGTNANNCKNVTTLTVTVNSLPVISVNSASICIGATATLTAGGASTYSWNTGATASTINPSPNATTVYTVTGTNSNNCKNLATVTVTVYSLPVVSVNSATICSGSNAALNANGANTYVWNTGATTPSITPSPTVATIYTVTGVDLHGCKNSATSTVSVKPLPAVIPTANEVCVGQTIHLGANSLSGSIYNWQGPNSYVSSSQNPTIVNSNLTEVGIYTLTISYAGCSASSTVNVVVDAIPTISFAGLNSTSYNTTVSLNANVPLVGTGTWQVISGTGSIANNTLANAQITNLQIGSNLLQWTISNGVCPASTSEIVITVIDLMVPTGFSPNGDGVNDNFEINGLIEYDNVKINVFNRWGNLVYDNNDYKNNWNGKNMSGEDLSDDTYFFTLEIPTKNTIKGYVVLKRK